jgi:hypothetical protein
MRRRSAEAEDRHAFDEEFEDEFVEEAAKLKER